MVQSDYFSENVNHDKATKVYNTCKGMREVLKTFYLKIVLNLQKCYDNNNSIQDTCMSLTEINPLLMSCSICFII